MTAAVLSTGDELTRGELVDTNAAWLSDRLTALGCRVREHRTVPDDQEAIGEAVRSLCAAHRFVVCTGGLGPTTDDLTAAAVAAAAGVELRRDRSSLERIGRRRAARGREMTAADAAQADLPEGAEVLPNPAGTAPGFEVKLSGCRAYFLPGVPSEMRRMFEESVQPRLASLVQRRSHQVRLRTFGLPESAVAERLVDLEREFEGVTLGYRSSFPEIEVKVRAQGSDHAAAAELTAAAAAAARQRLGDVVYSEGEDSYPAYIGRCLRDRGLTLALAESCTGGMIGSMLVGVPGSSEYLLLDAVTYSNQSKTQLLGVRPEILRGHGAVSAECAAAMAQGARRIVHADIAVSVTGIAGPGGGTEKKPVGTVWMGVVAGITSETHHFVLHGDRDQIRRRAAYLALRLVARAALAQNTLAQTRAR